MLARQEFPSTGNEALFLITGQRNDHVHLGGSTIGWLESGPGRPMESSTVRSDPGRRFKLQFPFEFTIRAASDIMQYKLVLIRVIESGPRSCTRAYNLCIRIPQRPNRQAVGEVYNSHSRRLIYNSSLFLCNFP